MKIKVKETHLNEIFEQTFLRVLPPHFFHPAKALTFTLAKDEMKVYFLVSKW